MAPKRYSGGITNVSIQNTMGQLITMDPTKVITYMNDFFKFDPGEWIVTRSEGSLAASDVGTASYEQITDATNGVLAVVTSIQDNDYAFFQYGGAEYDASSDGPREIFALASGKKLWFKSRLKVNDADTCDMIIGLYATDTSPVASRPANGFFFSLDDGTTDLDYTFNSSSVALSSETGIYTVLDDTYFTVGFYYDGGGIAKYFVDDIERGSATGVTVPTTELAVSFGIQNGSAAASTLSLDYICCIRER